MPKKVNKVGRTAWDFLHDMRPKNLKFFHWIFIFIAVSTIVAIYSGNPDGNIFYYIRVVITRLYQDQNTLVALLIFFNIVLLVLICVLLHHIYNIYKPRIKDLEEQNKEKKVSNTKDSNSDKEN